LGEDDRVFVVLGDTLSGGRGMRAQTFPQTFFSFKLLADPFGTGIYEAVVDLGFPIIGGPVHELVVVAPSEAVVGEPSRLQVRALDRWGNPDSAYRGTVYFSGDLPHGCPASYTFNADDAGVHWFETSGYQTPGVLRTEACDPHAGLGATSNPTRCRAEAAKHRLFWGDLHGQTEETVGTGSIPEYFAYARDIAAVDATAHSGNDFQITREVYQQLREASQHAYEPGRFVTFHGYEWSGNTPAGGDHNVYYRDDGPIRRSSHTEVEDKSDIETDCYPITRLYEANAGNDDVLITPHIGGRRANLDFHDPALEPAIELASQWGRFEWFAHDALHRGMRVAFIGGSDDHSGRPGWSAPTLAHSGVRGGLTAYLATELTRDGIWDALRSRRCYGTSGPRIVLDVTVNGHEIGSEPLLEQFPEVAVRVLGTAPLDTIELRRGVETVYTHSALVQPEPDEPWRIRLAWRGARDRGRTRPLDWTGGLTVWQGEIRAVENYAIDSPLDGVVRWDRTRIHWNSHTCGDWDGVTVDLDGDADTRLEFDSPAIRFSCTLGELAVQHVERAGALLEQRVVLRRLSHQQSSPDASFVWRDDAPRAGINPYWIWVTQADGEMAWSTPVYVQREGAGNA
jgi:hypothetical protein